MMAHDSLDPVAQLLLIRDWTREEAQAKQLNEESAWPKSRTMMFPATQVCCRWVILVLAVRDDARGSGNSGDSVPRDVCKSVSGCIRVSVRSRLQRV